MKRSVRAALIAAGAVVMVGLAAGAWVLRSATRADPLAASLAGLASIPLETSSGTGTTLGAIAPAGRPTVITFWASWCVPCIAETKALVAGRARYGASELAIVAIDLDTVPRDAARMGRFLDRTGARSLTQTLGTAATYRLVTGHKTVSLPRGFVFSRSGGTVLSLAGYQPGKTDAEIAATLRTAVGH